MTMITTVRNKFELLLPILALGAVLPCVAQESEKLTNADILKLSKAGLPANVITAKISSSETDFDMSIDTLLALSEAGVHADVLAAMAKAGKEAPAPAVSTVAPAAAGEVVIRQSASAAANVQSNFEGTRCEGPGIYLDDGRDLKLIEPTTISQKQSGSGVFSRMTYGIASVKSRAAIRGARSSVRIENDQPKFLFCFEESQAGLSYTTKGAVNPSEFPLVSLYVNEKKRQRSFVIGKMNAWSGSRSGATPEELRDIKYKRVKPGVYEAEPVEDIAKGEYAFYFAGESQTAGSMGGGSGGKLFPFGVD